MIDLYAFTRHPGPPLPDVEGLFEVEADGIAAVCAPASGAEDEVTPDALWRHEEVVEALMEERDVLPARYGTQLRSAEEAARATAERVPELLSALEHVRGAVELSLRVRGRGGEESSGLHDRLSRLARDSVTSAGRDEGEVLRAAYLVERRAVERFSAEVTRLQAENEELALLLTGPWPPYSFAGVRHER